MARPPEIPQNIEEKMAKKPAAANSEQGGIFSVTEDAFR